MQYIYPLVALFLILVSLGGIWALHKKHSKKIEAPPAPPPVQPLTSGHFVWKRFLREMQEPGNNRRKRRKEAAKNRLKR